MDGVRSVPRAMDRAGQHDGWHIESLVGPVSGGLIDGRRLGWGCCAQSPPPRVTGELAHRDEMAVDHRHERPRG